MEVLGVLCVAADRHRCREALSHAAVRAAMDVVEAGVVVVPPASLGNPYYVDKIRVFVEKGQAHAGVRRAQERRLPRGGRRGEAWRTVGEVVEVEIRRVAA
ncbi:Os03g0447100 [Oryza sativa Japonica Group]|uniref:Os03g0447100 protein n=1 Tax=Oryza sativa subsp. japonica TaxID=39947 RepID=A0A0P0W043_ORYSJ|nr:Os03g0447100 [Oryza sativa Japonica Group]